MRGREELNRKKRTRLKKNTQKKGAGGVWREERGNAGKKKGKKFDKETVVRHDPMPRKSETRGPIKRGRIQGYTTTGKKGRGDKVGKKRGMRGEKSNV